MAKRWAWSGSKLFDTLMEFLKDLFLLFLKLINKTSTDDKRVYKITQHAMI